MRKLFWILISLLWLTAGARADDDFQYWSQLSLRAYKSEKLDFVVFTDSRFMHNAEKLGLYYISPRLVYHHSENLDFGLNYTSLRSRSVAETAVDDSFNQQHRAEIEVNPQWALADWVKLKMRNRVEFRWIEQRGSDNTRYRQRWMLEFPLKDTLPLKSVYIYNEFFYDFRQDRLNENWTVPLGLNFKVSDKVGLQVFCMLQAQKGKSDWSSNQVLGTLIAVDF